ncbi:hypothetical protein F5Y00DRAFT_266404 [Daldinia vernicosa]|uniref:uncharacterized protein n=1 Tax=Daldinia vernicosa TaxID=114800 RepID=UPI002008D4F5|nr:uncharacterized protein F5Y00DRAFT_266404 [Daldinia vernicosa]KAI0844576.1 hypothetical protein F5Y00DRAFT_266404 [Daldinia vernicosa]
MVDASDKNQKQHQKKRAVQDLEKAAESGFSGRLVVAMDDSIKRHSKRGRLIDMADLSDRPAINFSLHGPNHMTAKFGEGEVMERDLIPLWKQQKEAAERGIYSAHDCKPDSHPRRRPLPG